MEVLESKGSKSSNSNIITPGCAVLLDINNGDKLTFAHLNKNARVKIGNMNCWLDALIGNSFGSVFEVQSGPKGASFVRMLPPSTDASLGESEKEGAGAVAEDDTQIKDNRGLIDNNTAQTLSAEDIHKMRNEGASGKMIMEALVANSATFQGKTAFSQEKYLRKKQKKYAPRVVVRRPSARSVCEAYFAKDPNKIGFLRMDMLALMLSLANVGANAEVLVLDMLGGLLTAAVAERLGGYGSICSMYHTSKPQTIDMVRLFNFDAATSSRVVRASLSQLLATKAADLELLHETKGQDIDDGAKNFKTPDLTLGTISMAQPMEDERVPENTTGFIIETQVAIQVETEVGVESREGKAIVTSVTQVEEQKTVVESRIEDDATEIAPKNSAKRKADSETDYNDPGKTMKAGRPASKDDMERWGRQGFTSLIVGAPFIDPWTVAEKLLPLLASSAPFVIYHPYLQPLADCMNKMQTERMAVALQLQEPWLREYQVLPSRTHPNMQMSSTGGWVLTGIRTTNA